RRLGSSAAPHVRGRVQRRTAVTMPSTRSGYSASTDQSVYVEDFSSDHGEALQLRTGHMARFADGAVVASRGDSAVLATVVTKPAVGTGPGFIPLTVDFRQSAAAVGKIPTNYFRRELGQSDSDILVSRIIDRSVRPLIPGTVGDQIQLSCKPLAAEDDSDPVTLAVNAASAALQLSPIPLLATSAAVRVAIVGGKPIVNPTRAALRDADADLLLTGSSGKRTLMIEMDGKEIPLDLLEESMHAALTESDRVIRAIMQLADGAAKQKREAPAPDYTKLDSDLAEICGLRLEFILTEPRHDKTSRDEAIQAVINEEMPGLLLSHKDRDVVKARFGELNKKTIRSLILRNSERCDGRKLDDFRPITIEVDVFKKLHGSALFQRGQTQVMTTCTFDSPSASFHPDSIAQLLGSQRKKSFMLHYEFPGYANNEITIGRGSNRRELGHGALAEKGLKHLVPADFPFCVRLACQVLESNGSSSMASVCAGSMALLDAGVPIKAQAAGVAIGMVSDETTPDKKYKILTDLGGIEDYAGDMDFKMAGTAAGFTAIQLDVKNSGLTKQQLHESLARGQSAINRLVNRQDAVISRPRETYKASVPVLESLQLDSVKRSMLFRNGGMIVKQIEADTGVKISHDDEKHISLMAPNSESLEQAKKLIGGSTADADESKLSFGQHVDVEVVSIRDSGIDVLLPPYNRYGKTYFIPNKRLSVTKILHPSAIGAKVGFKIKMKWLGRDPTGNLRWSREEMKK
ncbi:hypothetical protein PMAYCL1PPCAC_01038, partial [Pristionchus mayeri]